jgi:hypothetical protein
MLLLPKFLDYRSQTMTLPGWVVPLALAALMVDAIVELSFISSMVAWLHHTAGGDFEVIAPETPDKMSFLLHGKPKGLLVDQGHTSNGAAGTAFVLVGIGGILVIILRHKALNGSRRQGLIKKLYHAWIASTIISAVLTLAALLYTFILTKAHKGQTIDIDLAISLGNRSFPNQIAYPEQLWTPENWFDAVLELPLVDRHQREDIANHLTIMRAWRWNMIPLFVLGIILSAVAIVDAWTTRREYKPVNQYKLEPVRGRK